MTPTTEADVALAESSSAARDTARSGVEVSISIRTLLLVTGAVAIAWALASIGSILLLIFVAIFNVAVLSPVVTAMERRLGWSRGRCSTVLVLGILIFIGAVVLVLVQAISDAVRGFSDDLPQIVDKVRHSDLGNFTNGESDALDTLREHASDITAGVGKVSGGVADLRVSAFGAVTLFFSVIFLGVLAFGALFGLIGAIIGVPIAAALQILVEELTAPRRTRIAAADAAVGSSSG